jgi:predicted transcriptional regulator
VIARGIKQKEIFTNIIDYSDFLKRLGSSKRIKIEISNFMSGSRRNVISKAGEEVAQLAVKKLGMSGGEVARYLGVTTSCINRRTSPSLYLLKRLTALTNREIGELFGISYSAVSKAFADMEELSKENQKVKKEIDVFISRFKA